MPTLYHPAPGYTGPYRVGPATLTVTDGRAEGIAPRLAAVLLRERGWTLTPPTPPVPARKKSADATT